MLAIHITIASLIHSCLGFSFGGVFVYIVLLKINLELILNSTNTVRGVVCEVLESNSSSNIF